MKLLYKKLISVLKNKKLRNIKYYLSFYLFFLIFMILYKNVYSKSINQKTLEKNLKNTIAINIESSDKPIYIKILEDSSPEVIKEFKRKIKKEYFEDSCSLFRFEDKNLIQGSCTKKEKNFGQISLKKKEIYNKYSFVRGVFAVIFKEDETLDLIFILGDDMEYLNSTNAIIVGYILKNIEELDNLAQRKKTAKLKINSVKFVEKKEIKRNGFQY